MRRFTVKSGQGPVTIRLEELLYAESFHDRTTFVCEDRKVDSLVSFAKAVEYLTPLGFFRCHRNYIVSSRKIARIGDGYLVMENADTVPFSPRRREELLQTVRLAQNPQS
ncbi:MAG: LytTR family transcriptional regulator [Parasporobacterium sp.]|nr:LytTR family transcriptional regulator [Parasporobacterium sp.]